jgi:hypothetical protein
MLASLAAMGRRRPFALSLFTSTAKTLSADLMTQRFIEGREEVDLRRAGLFTVFGFYYLGGFQYWLYVRCFGRWFPNARRFGDHPTVAARLADAAGLRDLIAQTAAGNFLHIPLVFLPAFYVTQEVTERGRDASPLAALARYRHNCWDDWISAWAIWIPGHALFFSVPMWLRLPTNHAMSFAYVCVLSLMRGRAQPALPRDDAHASR